MIKIITKQFNLKQNKHTKKMINKQKFLGKFTIFQHWFTSFRKKNQQEIIREISNIAALKRET